MKKSVDKSRLLCYYNKAVAINTTKTKWPVGQEVKTPPFHGSNTSSILVRVTNGTHNFGYEFHKNFEKT